MTTTLSPYTLSQLRTQVQQLTGDINGTRFSDAMLNDAINYAIKQLCLSNGYTYVQVPIVSGCSDLVQTLFPLTGSGYNYMDYLKINRVITGASPLPCGGRASGPGGSQSVGGWDLSWALLSSYTILEGQNNIDIGLSAPDGSSVSVNAVLTGYPASLTTFALTDNGVNIGTESPASTFNASILSYSTTSNDAGIKISTSNLYNAYSGVITVSAVYMGETKTLSKTVSFLGL